MKTKLITVLSLVLFLTPLSMFAASKNSQSVTFPKAVTVNGTQIPAGDYKVQWEGTGATTATINKGKKVLATTPATVTQAQSPYDGALQIEGNALQGIQFRNQAIQFNAANTAAASTGN
ncbi:hypothetical protein Acid345_2048 [Candidatus Koribacter versatilis Ellin345]|uniref:Uncharacterized protein n=1 Tax=Koribacter versatilis (strain Ellin345) TaxID=204669 RepID=Q1IQ01_KORVE|nr:hypothetical protein [Candidatus Koribacter versatilis]ABF41049.1 hypothetical protein Acid345_2048 [Candidatus Koribacter versatilis Ellin345]